MENEEDLIQYLNEYSGGIQTKEDKVLEEEQVNAQKLPRVGLNGRYTLFDFHHLQSVQSREEVNSTSDKFVAVRTKIEKAHKIMNAGIVAAIVLFGLACYYRWLPFYAPPIPFVIISIVFTVIVRFPGKLIMKIIGNHYLKKNQVAFSQYTDRAIRSIGGYHMPEGYGVIYAQRKILIYNPYRIIYLTKDFDDIFFCDTKYIKGVTRTRIHRGSTTYTESTGYYSGYVDSSGYESGTMNERSYSTTTTNYELQLNIYTSYTGFPHIKLSTDDTVSNDYAIGRAYGMLKR